MFGLLGPMERERAQSSECILGTRRRDSGSVSILGMDPKEERRRLFQMVGVQFQEGDYQNEIGWGSYVRKLPAFTNTLRIGGHCFTVLASEIERGSR